MAHNLGGDRASSVDSRYTVRMICFIGR